MAPILKLLAKSYFLETAAITSLPDTTPHIHFLGFLLRNCSLAAGCHHTSSSSVHSPYLHHFQGRCSHSLGPNRLLGSHHSISHLLAAATHRSSSPGLLGLGFMACSDNSCHQLPSFIPLDCC